METNKELLDFEWDDTQSFNLVEGETAKKEEPTEEKIEEPEKEKKEDLVEKPDDKEDKEPEKKPEEKEPEEEKVEEPFSEVQKEEEPEEEIFNDYAKVLKDVGVLENVEIPEDEEITQEKLIELQEQEIESRVEEAIEGFMGELDDDGKAFLKFKKEGGDTRQFFEMMKETSELPQGDIDDEYFQKKVTKYYLKTVDNMDDEDVEDRIAWLEETGKLERYAERYNNKLQTIKEKKEQEAVERQKQLAKQQEKDRMAFISTLKDTLSNTDSIKDFPITKQEKKELVDFITKPTIKVDKSKYVSGFSKAINEVTNDPQKLILLAKLLKNDFDISDVIKQTETKEVKKLKNNIQRAKKSSPPKTYSSNRKSLADFF